MPAPRRCRGFSPVWIAAAAIVLAAAGVARAAGGQSPVPVVKATVIRRFSAADATQGAAVGKHAFYVIANRAIAKYDRRSGRKLAEWADRSGEVVHLNSCSAWRARLYCAHSNYPGRPATSSIEIFDARTLAHVGHLSLGITPGSLTWIDRYDGRWWLCFAKYGPRNAATQLVEYDAHWRRRQAFVFPRSVIGAFSRMSASGGAWGPDGYLYVSGHDRPQLYVLRLPGYGSVLRQVATVTVPSHGQAFGWDPAGRRIIYTIDRPTHSVFALRIPPVRRPPGRLP